MDSAIIQEDLRFFPHYVIGGVDRKNNFFFPFTAELYTYMEVNRNDGFFNGLISVSYTHLTLPTILLV